MPAVAPPEVVTAVRQLQAVTAARQLRAQPHEDLAAGLLEAVVVAAARQLQVGEAAGSEDWRMRRGREQ